ncbi:hypothetical protein RM863_31135 [Streptomyces sp. DSM 41014]|uniref:Uncharacterized protein n=1 Tax=Streptomyces hintoniae TaxID=3075521 RepID=A0ABU2UU50_9ACTN|nr:hypothetical protein [Streptomyces sp. DSM 41014]MDT0476590.1 hypothetical protein [Streptomyces sp. DSM 41014]
MAPALGAVSLSGCPAELPSLVREIDDGGLVVAVREAPLADAESAWTAPEEPGVRTVLVP